MTLTTEPAASARGYEQLWYTRCPVPAASGVAFQLGWLSAAFAEDDINVQALQDAPEELSRHHFDHQLVGLFREGGNIPAIVARAEGAPTRLIGLTWIEEGQSIVVRPGSGIETAADLAGRKVGIPAWAETPATSFPRGMALHGFTQALKLAGLTLDDVEVVEFPSPTGRMSGPREGRVLGLRPQVEVLLDGTVDAVYGKGASFAQQVGEAGLVVAIDLDALPERHSRVNNGTPRPITVHQQLVDERPDLVVRFLAASLRASDWAAEHPDEVREILERETFSGPAGVAAAHPDDFHRFLHPELSDERLELFETQKQFLYTHGFIRQNFDLGRWAAPELLEQARQLVTNATGVGA